MRIKSVAVAAACAWLAAPLVPVAVAPATAQAIGEADATSRLIIKLRPGASAEAAGQEPGQSARVTAQSRSQNQRERARRLAENAGLGVRAARELGPGTVVLGLGSPLAGEQLAATLAALRTDPDVEFAEVDRRRYIRAVPNDPLYTSQWYLQGVEASATNFEAAWDTTTGSADTVIAVLDTGIRFEHPDLDGRVLPGYDFVSGESSSSFVSANDGNDWDDNASDPGDWVSSAEALSGPLAGCRVDDSSWHGTQVAGMLGAATDNGVGAAGANWTARILPVRVLGKCGGYDSDIVSGMRWAAGLAVDGVPDNPYPARILNLSLGGVGTCSPIYQEAIQDLNAAGVLVVVSAGNDNGPVEAPANCDGALAVAGLRHVGTKVGYSSFGPEVGVSAPAGNCPDEDSTVCAFKLVTTSNTGITVPGTSSYTDDPNCNLPYPFFFCTLGTSYSAPLVAAMAALMHGVNDGLTSAELIARIKSSARPFPTDPAIPTCPTLDSETLQCNCTTSTCGAGIADAPGAILQALRPIARIVKPDGNGAGQSVTLDGGASVAARNRMVVSYAWTAVSGDTVFTGGTNGETATVAVPNSGVVTVRLTVTDNLGETDFVDEELGVAPSGGGGGGGAIHPMVLITLGLLTSRRRRRQLAAQPQR